MKTTTITTNGGNRVELAMLGRASRDAIVTVHGRDGELVASWQGEIPEGLEHALVAASFRHVCRCESCGVAFRAKRATATTCSAACRTKLWRRRSLEREART